MELGSGNNKGKILFLVPQPFLVYRGSPFRVKATVSALSELGYKVDLLCFPYGQDVNIPNINIVRSFAFPGIKFVPIGFSYRKVLLDLLFFFKALILVSKNRYVLIHGVEETGLIAKTLGKLKGIPYIFDMHSRIPEQMVTYCPALKRLAEKFERFCIKTASAVITVADEMSQLSRAIAPTVPAFTLEDLPLLSSTDVDEEQVKKLKKQLGIGDSDNTIVYTGNFEPYQGVNLLIRSFAELIQNPIAATYKLILIGGLEEDINFIDSKKLVRDLKLTDRVIFAGTRPPEEMGAFMALADIVTSPRTEGTNTPLKIYSYMLARKPMVATDMRSHTQILTKNNCFLAGLTPMAFAQAFVECINNLKTNPAEVKRRVDAAEQLVKERFNPDKFKQTLALAYETAI